MELRFRDKLGSILLYLGVQSFLRFVTINPEWANIRVTMKCNSRCTTCYAWKRIPQEDELSTEELKDALSQIRGLGIRNVIFIGGEPLLRPDIGALAKKASTLGFKNIIVVTNGLLLKDKAEELVKNGVTQITVSIDGVKETNDAIRGVSGSYEKSIRGIQAVQRLNKAMGRNASVSLSTTILLNQNVEQIPELIKISKNLGVNWMFNLLDPNVDIFKGIPFSQLLVGDKEKIDETIDYIKEILRENPELISSCEHMLEYARDYLKGKDRYDFHCIHGYKMVYLGSHGEVYAGCWVLEPVGNIRVNSLHKILESEKYREMAKKMYMNECPGCTNRFEPNIAMKHLLSHHLFCGKQGKKQKTA
jgi:MoaA/NifB/PqqE/SkfB family radical SAM enzyme